MSTNTFFMLGVIHRDEEGPFLLNEWLRRIRPDVITLELSSYGIRFRRERGEEFNKRISEIVRQLNENGETYNEKALESLFAYMNIPYEFGIVSTYAAKYEIPFYLIDMDFFSYMKLRTVEDLLHEENIMKVLSDTRGPNRNQEKAMARLYFEKGIKVAKYDREMHIRDRYMTAKIHDLMKRYHGKRFLHVCGWQHLQDPSNLYSVFNPTKVFSHDKTVCL